MGIKRTLREAQNNFPNLNHLPSDAEEDHRNPIRPLTNGLLDKMCSKAWCRKHFRLAPTDRLGRYPRPHPARRVQIFRLKRREGRP